jgi:hypothetical protein
VKRICSWCRKELDESGPQAVSGEEPVSHGICPDCIHQISTHRKKDLRSYLDHFDFPVFLMDSNVGIITANKKGFSALRKKPEEVEGRLGGDAFDCKYAALPGGCGKTIHCKSCAIRLTVTDTYRTGKSHEKVPAYPDLNFITRETRIRFLISTEKHGDAVLLQIDEIAEEKKE